MAPFHVLDLSVGAWLARIGLILAACLAICIAFVWQRTAFPLNAPKRVSSNEWPVLGVLDFFHHRWDFHSRAANSSRTGNFSYYIGKHSVIGLSGPIGRKMFLESSKLHFGAGYAVLFGQGPKVRSEPDEDIAAEDRFGQLFAKRLKALLRTEVLKRNLSLLIGDTRAIISKLAASAPGVTDPFQSIYQIVFQLTIRTVGCTEIAEDPNLLAKTLVLYETIDNSSTAATVIFPGLPTPAYISRFIAGAKLYKLFQGIVDERKKTGTRHQDPLQHLIDQGDSIQDIIGFVLGALFAGQLNSGINAAYLLVYLTADRAWMDKARDEVETVARRHAVNKEAPLTDQLADIPLEAWENEFPTIDLCLKETIRLQLLGTAFRRNVTSGDLPIGDTGEVIPKGAFVTYALADVHQDANIYPEPLKWDASRYLPGRAEHQKLPYGYIGWGTGRHPCLGMRFAKLEQNIITSYWLATFTYDRSDKNGNPTSYLPPPRLNAHSASKPDPNVYLRYSVRE